MFTMPEAIPFEILVVDDEPPIFDLLVRVSKTLFPEATFTNTRSAQETLDYLQRASGQLPQLVLLDIDLKQDVDGLGLLPDLQARLKGQIPIIMLSIQGDEQMVQAAYDRGAVAYTRKPEELDGWKNYVSVMRSYWYQAIRLPPRD